MRYKIRLQSSVTIKHKQKEIKEQIAEKLDEYHNSAKIKDLLKLPQMKQVNFYQHNSFKKDIVQQLLSLKESRRKNVAKEYKYEDFK